MKNLPFVVISHHYLCAIKTCTIAELIPALPFKPVALKQQIVLISFQTSPSFQISCLFHSYRILPCSLLAALFMFLKTSSIPSFRLLFMLSSLQYPMSHPNHMFSERLTVPQFLLSLSLFSSSPILHPSFFKPLIPVIFFFLHFLLHVKPMYSGL